MHTDITKTDVLIEYMIYLKNIFLYHHALNL